MNKYLCWASLIAVASAFPTTPKVEKTLPNDSTSPKDVNVRQGYNNYPVQQTGFPDDGYPENYPSQTGILPGSLNSQQHGFPVQAGIISGNFPVSSQQAYPVSAGILPGSLPVAGNYPAIQPGNYPVGSLNNPVANLPGQHGIGDVPPHPLNSRPSYAYDSAYPDEVNFQLADPHRNVAAALQTGLQTALGGATELLQTGYQGKPAVSASAAVVKGPQAF